MKNQKSGLMRAILLLLLFIVAASFSFGQDFYNFVWKLDGNGTDYHFNYPRIIAFDSKDNFYMNDWENYWVLKFDKNGNYIRKIGSQGSGSGQFDSPQLMISVDKNDNVYVINGWSSGGPRVQKFSIDGEFIEAWSGTQDWGPVPAIANDAGGNSYLKTWGQPVIQKYDLRWNYLDGFGYMSGVDNSPYAFSYPGYIAVNSKGDVFVSVWGDASGDDGFRSRIKKFGANFQFLTECFLDSVTAITIDSQDNVFACPQRNTNLGVYKYDSNLNFIQTVTPNSDWDHQNDLGATFHPHSIAVDSEGNIYVGDMANRIQKFAPPYIKVDIDIKPGSYPNTINLGSNGVIPVAILSSSTFDATTVDPISVSLAGANVRLKGNGNPMASFQDVNKDGVMDIIVHVETSALDLTATDTIAVLTGKTQTGRSFKGQDTVRIVK
jgi:sugar lactone lactonase YvrE